MRETTMKKMFSSRNPSLLFGAAMLVIVLVLAAGCTVPQVTPTGGETTPVRTTTLPEGAPQVMSFDASPVSIDAGEVATLSWSVAGAQSVEIDHGIGAVALSGNRPVEPVQTTVYTLTATSGSGKTTTATARVSVRTAGPAATTASPTIQIMHFEANPQTILPGDMTTLSWSVTGADSVKIEPGIGPVAMSGTRQVSPSAETTYTLTASAAGGGSSIAKTVVHVQRPIHSEGVLSIDQTYDADLDEGVVGITGPEDFWFKAVTPTDRFVTSRNGARFAVTGPAEPGYDACIGAPLSTADIDVNLLSPGTHVCYITSSGRIGWFRVNAPVGPSPGVLEIRYLTWE
jgi:hypothetical protein